MSAAVIAGGARPLLRRYRDSSLLRNSIYIMATAVVTSLLGYVFWIVTARSYAPHHVGLAAALVSAMTLAATVISLGLAATLVQCLPRRAGRAWSLTLNTVLVAGALGGLVLAIALVLVLPWLSAPFAVLREQPTYAALFVAGVLLTIVGILLDHTFIAERAASKMLARNLLFSVLRVPLLPLAVLVGVGASGVLGAWVLSTAASATVGGLLLLRLRRRYRPAIRGFATQLRSLVSPLAGHHFISLGGALPEYLLPLLVAALLSPTDNAYFYTTWMVCNALFMVPYAVASSLFAEGSHAAHDLRHQVRMSLLATGGLLVPLMLVLLAAGDQIMAAFGPSYPEHALPVLTLIALSAVPDAITSIYISVLRVRQRLRFAAALTTATAVLTIGLAWLLLPSVGLIGAGWAVLVAQTAAVAAVGVHLWVNRRRKLISRADQPPTPSRFSA